MSHLFSPRPSASPSGDHGRPARRSQLLAALSLGAALLSMPLLSACGGASTPDHARGGTFTSLGFDEATLHTDGTPNYLGGRLKSTVPTGAPTAPSLGDAERTAQAAILGDLRNSYRLSASTTLTIRSSKADTDGQTLVRLQQHHNGLRVVGREVVVQLGRDGALESILGHLAPDLGADLAGGAAHMTPDAALSTALSTLTRDPTQVRFHSLPELAIYTQDTTPRLVYGALVEYPGVKGRALEELFVDANDGSVVARLSHIYDALHRDVYTLSKVCVKDGSELPGKLLFSEGGSSTDAPGTRAYNNSGNVYWFYKHSFGRDSYDDKGANLASAVLATFDTGMGGCDGGNAAWVGAPYSIMLYGEGSFFGFLLKEMTLGFDVAAHEMTHAVTNATSDLAYMNESGALNEAMSDILGATAEAWQLAGGGAAGSPATYAATDRTWKIGEDVVGPLLPIPGGALRSMSNPTVDMMSKDFYSERYLGMDDNGGVHLNSGIANLAFYLMTAGGSHPRGKSPSVVPAIGIDKAMRIFYYTDANLLTSMATFQDARYASARAAEILYGRCGAEFIAVHRAWDAVGVPGDWSLCVTPPGGF